MQESNYKRPKVIIFDLDGTIAHTIPQLAIAAREAIIAVGCKPPEVEKVQTFVGNGAKLLLARCLTGRFDTKIDEVDKDLLDKSWEAFKVSYMKNLAYNYQVYNGVYGALAYFKSLGILLAVSSNKPNIFIKPLLKYMGLYQYFDYCLGGEVLEHKKPHPEPLEHVAKSLNVDVSDCLMVGDSVNDIEAGHNAKMVTVGFTFGYNGNKDIRDCHPDFVFDSYKELVKLIEQSKQ